MRAHITRGIASVILALSLAACGGSSNSGPSESSESSSSEASSSTSSSSGSAGCAESDPSDEDMPKLEDNAGSPVLSFPGSTPPCELKSTVLEEGGGAEIGANDLITADYVGQVWGNDTPFDSSFASGRKLEMSLDQLVPGWSKALAGKHVGDKVIMSLPPDDGYGSEGNPQAGIDGDDTIVFYVEIHDAISKESAGQADAQVETDAAALPVEIDGEVGQPVTGVKIKDGTPEPTELQTTVIARGSGPEVGESGLMFVAYYMTSYDGTVQDVTWGEGGSGPQQVYLGNEGLLDELRGLPVGSRTLISFPASDGGEQNTRPAGYAVVDILRYSEEGAVDQAN
ncbi:MAG: FKBP-type peptidyl-prolyl cis-trans isomerase [Actinomycetaceae bacterium]|nr:FKBP-type peptidyl-prolyl cis-trans isomerase [Actinomycetaceae bacterium]